MQNNVHHHRSRYHIISSIISTVFINSPKLPYSTPPPRTNSGTVKTARKKTAAPAAAEREQQQHHRNSSRTSPRRYIRSDSEFRPHHTQCFSRVPLARGPSHSVLIADATKPFDKPWRREPGVRTSKRLCSA